MRFFITHILPQNRILKYNQSIAAHLFCYKLIDAHFFDKTYSILPPIAIAKEELNYERNIIPIYSCIRNSPILYRFAFILENIYMIYHIPKQSSVWFYNLPYISILLFWGLKIFKPSVSLNIILLDYTPSQKGLKGLKEKLLLYSINRSNGIIKLADSFFVKNSNSICLPGIVSINAIKQPKITTIAKTFLISGVLGDNIAMLPMLLDAFSKMPDMQLHITGKAPDLVLLNQYTQQCNNIIYHGLVEYEEYLRILHDTTFLLSTRNPAMPENQCNFPSKIIEALLHNRIVVSTIHYEQLEGIRYLEVAADLDKFKLDLSHIAQMPETDLLTYANQADNVRQRFHVGVWKEWMQKIEGYEKRI